MHKRCLVAGKSSVSLKQMGTACFIAGHWSVTIQTGFLPIAFNSALNAQLKCSTSSFERRVEANVTHLLCLSTPVNGAKIILYLPRMIAYNVAARKNHQEDN